jgi:hypothetical protein
MHRRRRMLLIRIVGLACVFGALPWTRGLALKWEGLESALSEQLEFHPAELLGIGDHGISAAEADRALARVYHENGLRPLWVTPEGPGGNAGIILSFLRAADTEGLNPADYYLEGIERYWA